MEPDMINQHEQDAWDRLTPKQKNQWLFEQVVLTRRFAQNAMDRLDRLEKIHPLPQVIAK